MKTLIRAFTRILLPTSILYLGLFLLLPATNAKGPWIIALDADKGLTYFDEKGKALSRTELKSPAPASSYLDVEFGDLIPGNGWFEVMILREGFWLDLFPLPRPGEKSVNRMDYFRFDPVAGVRCKDFSLASHPGRLEIQYVFLFPDADIVPGPVRTFLYEKLNTGRRAQEKLAPLDIILPGRPDDESILLADLGMNPSDWNLAVLTSNRHIRLARLGQTGGVEWLPQHTEIPEKVNARKIRLVGDAIYILDDNKGIHHWQIKGDRIESMGKPVRLETSADIIGFSPLAR